MTKKSHDNVKGALWGCPLSVVNIGLELFGATLEQQNIPTVHVNWVPPAAGRHDIIGLLDDLVG